MSQRYIVVEGSETAHCCFEYTVVDTTKLSMAAGDYYNSSGVDRYEPICECFERAEAEKIALCLNWSEELSKDRT